MRPGSRVAAAVLLISAAGCDPAVRYSAASARAYPERPPKCDLAVFTSSPARPWDEIGTFEVAYTTHWDRIEVADDLRGLLGERACQLGADGLIGLAEYGAYTRAVAFRWKVPEPAPAATAP